MVKSLDTMAERGAHLSYRFEPLKGLRYLPYKKYAIVYEIQGNVVLIHTIYNMSLDFSRLAINSKE